MENLREVFNKQFNSLMSEYEIKIQSIEKEYNEKKQKLDEEHEERKKVLDEAYNNSQLKKSEYSHYMKKEDKNYEKKLKELHEEFAKKLEEQTRLMKSNKGEIKKSICDKLEVELESKYSNQKDVLLQQLKEKEDELKQVEEKIADLTKEYKKEEDGISEKYSAEKKELKANMSKDDTKKLNRDYAIIPEERKEELINYIKAGAVPIKVINELEVATANETKEQVLLEELDKKEINEKLILGKKYEQDNSAIFDRKNSIVEEINDIKQQISSLEQKREQQKKEIQMTRTNIDGQVR